MRVEAIIRDFDRPTLLIVGDTWQQSMSPTVNQELESHRPSIEAAIKGVGRVEFGNVSLPWGGTGWVVDEDIVITDRHVAEIVAEADGCGGFAFRMTPSGRPAGARLDFRAEHGSPSDETAHEVPLVSVRYLATIDQPDIALFQVASDATLPTSLALSDRNLNLDTPIVVIGYPAYDSRVAAERSSVRGCCSPIISGGPQLASFALWDDASERQRLYGRPRTSPRPPVDMVRVEDQWPPTAWLCQTFTMEMAILGW